MDGQPNDTMPSVVHNGRGRHQRCVRVSCSGSKFHIALTWNIHLWLQIRLQNTQVKFIQQGHQIKVKVTGAKLHVCISCLQECCLRLKGNLANYNNSAVDITQINTGLTARVHVTVGSGRPLARHSSCRIPFTSTLTSAAGYTSTVGGPAVAKHTPLMQNYSKMITCHTILKCYHHQSQSSDNWPHWSAGKTVWIWSVLHCKLQSNNFSWLQACVCLLNITEMTKVPSSRLQASMSSNLLLMMTRLVCKCCPGTWHEYFPSSHSCKLCIRRL